MPEPGNNNNPLYSPLDNGGSKHLSAQKNGNGQSNTGLGVDIEELQRVNEELRQARRAALNLMEDAILSKEALRQSEEKYRTKLEQDVRDRTAELNASKELIQATMDASMDMMQVFKAVRNNDGEIVDFKYVLLNHEAEKWMPDAVGKTLLQLQPGVVEEGIFDAFKQVTETGVPKQYEKHYVHEQFDGWFYQSVVKMGDGVATTTTNITERKEAEAQLLRLKDEIAQKATDKYLILFNSIDEAVVWCELITDDAGNGIDLQILEVNPAFEKMTGLTAEAVLGRRGKEILPTLEDWWIETYTKVAQSKEAVRVEHEMAGIDRWFEVYASPIGGSDSKEFVLVFSNITERKRQEKKQAYLLKLSDATRSLSNPDEILNVALKTVAEYLNLDRIGYNEIDADVTEYWYRACYAREGFAPVLGRFQMGPFQETVKNLQKGITFIANDAFDDSFSEAEKEVHRIVKVGAYVTVPLVKKGRWVCNLVAHYSKARKWRKDEIEILEETAERIWAAVERAKAEEALRESEEKYRTLFETMGQGYAVCKMIRDADGRAIDLLYVDLNPAFERLTGLTVAQVKGKTGGEVYGEVEPLWLEEYDSVIKNNQPRYIENKFEPTDRWYGVYVYPAADDSVICLFEDITERKFNERRQSFLLQLSDALRSLSDPVEIQSAATKLLSTYFDTARCYYMEIDDEHHLAYMRAESLRADIPSAIGAYDLKLFEEVIAKIRNGKPLVIGEWSPGKKAEMKLEERYKKVLSNKQIMAQISVPIIKRGKLIATLTISDNRPRGWNQQDIEVLEEAADRTWAAVEQARAEEAVAADLRDTRILHRLSEQLVSEENVDVIYQHVMDVAIRLTNADAGTVQILDDTQELLLLATSGFPEYVIKHFARVNAGSNTSCGIALENRQRTFIDFDVPEEEDPDGSLRLHVKAGYYSAQSTPLISRSGKTIGMVSTHWKENHHRPTERELLFLDLLARQAADLIEQRQSEKKLRDFASRLEQQVAERTLDLKQSKELLQTIYDHVPIGLAIHQPVYGKKGAVEDFEIKFVNEELVQLTGRTDLIGKKYAEEFPGIKTNGLFSLMVEAMNTGKMQQLEFYYPHEHFNRWFFSRFIKAGDLLVATNDDITHRKKADEELAKNLAILQQAEEIAQIGSWEYDVVTGDFKWSNGMYKLFGLPEGKAVRPSTYVDFSVEEDRSVAKRILKNLEKTHQAFEETMRIKRGEDIRLLRIKGSIVNNDAGQAQKIIGVDLDITELRAAHEKLQEHSRFIEQIARTTPDVITIFNLKEKRITYINHVLPNFLGFTGQELMQFGKDLAKKMIHPEEQFYWQEDKRAIIDLKDGEVKETLFRIQDKGGAWHYINSKSAVFKRNEKGAVVEVLSLSRDVTREYELKKQLIERSQFVEALIDNSVDRIMAFDQDYNLTAWNRRCEEMYRLKKEEVIGTSFFQHFPKIQSEPMLMEGMTRAQNGELVHLPSQPEIYRASFGELFFIPLKTEEGNTQGILVVMHDVTNVQLAKEELNQLNKTLERKNLELQRKNEELSSFAFIASHDLREPLRKIHTFSDWLLTKEVDRLTDMGKSYLERMDLSVKRLNLLISDILALTQIHTVKEKREKVSLAEVLHTVQEEMKERIEEKSAIIEAQELIDIEGIRQQLIHLFRNLLSNALKFQKEGHQPVVQISGELIEAKEISNSQAREGEYYRLVFKDNGVGFAARYKHKIFEIFQRLNVQDFKEGTGMGLAICRKIMENHGGFITADSVEGKGATFCCYFPV